jgi:hypothetical protein
VLSRGDIGRHLMSEMVFSGDRLPGFSDTIEHPDGLVLVDTGMIGNTGRRMARSTMRTWSTAVDTVASS